MRHLRSIILLLFLGGAIFLLIDPLGLAAPRKSDRQQDALRDRPGVTVVTYWEKWTGLEGQQMQQIVDDFNATVGAEKKIFVQYLSMSSVDQKTLIATAAGVPPDIAGVWDTQIPGYAGRDALEPLDDLAREYGITEDYYKPVYWKGCTYDGKLCGLISTPWCVAFHWNKEIVAEKSAELRAAGLDPAIAPRTLEELDRWSSILDILRRDPSGNVIGIDRAGYLPLEPGWYTTFLCYWFGGELYDPATRRLTLTHPGVIRAYEWIRKSSLRLGGPQTITLFRNPNLGVDSVENPFLKGTVAAVQQGPWMANYIEQNKPSMNRWHMTPQQLAARKNGAMSRDEFRETTQWGASAYPVPADLKDPAGRPLTNVTYAGFDVFVIPRGAKHKREAFEFIAWVNRPEVMGKLCKLHCKNSPLSYKNNEPARKAFIADHPNPYIEVFEELASSPNARGVPPVPIWAEVGAELSFAAEKVWRLTQEPQKALQEAQSRAQAKLDKYWERQAKRGRQ